MVKYTLKLIIQVKFNFIANQIKYKKIVATLNLKGNFAENLVFIQNDKC